jgi:hypothetical protein
LTTVKIFTGVLEAEEAMRKRKASGPKKPRKRGSKATESSDESGDDLEGESSEGIEVMDSIDS